MGSRLLVTGGCGFVGANVIAHLRRVGSSHEIRVFDDESLGSRATIEQFDVEMINGDLRDPEAVASATRGVDAIIHLAADTRVMDSITDPAHNFDVNVIGTFNLLTAARDNGVGRLVAASTGGAIIGETDPPVHEEMAPQPTSPYGASKLMLEGYCSAFQGSYGLSTACLRFSNVYGPLSIHKGSVVARFFRQILASDRLTVYGDGSQQRDFVFAGDLAEGIRQATEGEACGTFQLGTGRPHSINELIDLMAITVGSEYQIQVDYKKFRDGEIRNTYCDISKAQREIGYSAPTSLREGLDATWQWFQRCVQT